MHFVVASHLTGTSFILILQEFYQKGTYAVIDIFSKVPISLVGREFRVNIAIKMYENISGPRPLPLQQTDTSRKRINILLPVLQVSKHAHAEITEHSVRLIYLEINYMTLALSSDAAF